MRPALVLALFAACAPAAAAPHAPASAPPPVIRVLHHGVGVAAWPADGDVRLEGIDRRAGEAIVLATGRGRAAERRVIDLNRGTSTVLPYPSDLPAMQRQAADVAARAALPWAADAVTEAAYIYADASELLLLPRAGGDEVSLTRDRLPAAYSPVMSPDGATLAFTGAVDRAVIPPGAAYQAVYYLFFLDAPFVGRPLRRVTGPTFPTAPVFGATGDAYVVAQDIDHAEPYATHDHGGCLHRVRPRDGADAELLCVRDLTDVNVRVSPDGQSALLFGDRGPPAHAEHVLRWLALPSGAVRATAVQRWHLGTATGPGPSDRGLVVEADGEIEATDLATGAHAVLPGDGWRYDGVAAWRDDHVAWALRQRPETPEYEIVEIDVAALLARP